MLRRLFKILFMIVLILGTLVKVESATNQSLWITVSVSPKVHNVTRDIWYNTITNALAEASNGNVIDVYPGTYNEVVHIANFTNLTIQAWAWTNSQDNTNTVVDASGYNATFIIQNSKLVTIQGFSIIGATNGIYISDSVSNNIINNRIYSNYNGITLYNSDENLVQENQVYNNSTGIIIYLGSFNIIKSNNTYNNSGTGIYLVNDTYSNKIMNNLIYSNDVQGIVLNNVRSNLIQNNVVYGTNQDFGFIIDNNASYNKVFNNRIYANKYYNIFVNTNSYFNNITANTIFNSAVGISLVKNDTNNFIFNNLIYSNTYNIALSTNCNFNTITNNIIRGTNRGISVTSAKGNKIKDNVLNDSYISVQLVSDEKNYIENNNFTNNDIAVYSISSKSNSIRYNNFRDTLNYAFEAIYVTNNFIQNNIVDSSSNIGFLLFKSYQNYIDYNKIYNSGSAITLYSNCYYNQISYNTNYNNQNSGIVIMDICSNNYIANNLLYNNNQMGATNGGIIVFNSSFNIITNNVTYGSSQSFGVALINYANNNKIVNNQVYGSNYFGLVLSNGIGNYAEKNDIYQNNIGVFLQNATVSTLRFNNVYNNATNGIEIEYSTNIEIAYNYVANNNDAGFKVQGARCKVFLNTIVSNNIGVSVTNSVLSNFTKNNIYTNTTWNFLSLTAYNLPLTNNWWGTTILTGIRSKVQGATNLIPYRLFGEFDISSPTNDTDSPQIPSNVTATVDYTNVILSWTHNGVDTVRYFIYRSTESSPTNLDRSSVIGETTTLSFTDYGAPLGTNYYYITALDDAQPGTIYTNESWYSTNAMAYVFIPNNVHNVTIDKWYTNINSALAEASNGNVIDVYPGTYNEIVDLTGFSNLTLQAYAFTNSGDNTNTIIAGDNNNPVVTFDNTKKCRLIGFTIKYGKEEAILISDNNGDSYSNYIANNIIFSNDRYGISLEGDNNDLVYGNIIVSNIIYSNYNGGGDRGGIYILDADNNQIEYNRIYKFDEAGIVLMATASNNYIFKNTIYSNVNYGISINDNNVLENTILSNYCYNQDIGIFIGDAAEPQNIIGNWTYNNTSDGIFVQTSGNRIYYNTSYSNTAGSGIRIENIDFNTNYGNILFDNLYGIYINQGDNTSVQSNYVYNNITGIYGFESSDIIVRANNVYNNITNGIYLQDNGTGTTGDKIINNNIYSNSVYGILLSGDKLDNNEIMSNQIYDNTSSGVYINLSDNNRIFNNSLISGSTNGIYIVNGSDNTIVSNNYIANCSGYGIYAGEGTGLKINLNTITSNNIGLEYSDNVANPDLSFNNIFSNSKWNFALTVNQVVDITNVWWGSTIVTNILSKVTNAGTANNFNFIPYRLFGELNIDIGADVLAPQIITNVTTSVLNNTNIVLNNWTKVTDSDFVCYRIYRSTNSSFSNLSSANIVTQIYDANITTWTDKGLPPGYYYYHITYIDNPAPPIGSIYTNESWYSVEGSASIYPHQLKLTMNSNIESYALYPGQTNKTVMAFNVMDWWLNKNLAKLKITNFGTMSTNEIIAMKLWLDDGANTNTWDTSDTLVGYMTNIGSSGVWAISNIAPPLDIGNPGKNFVITIDISTNAIGYKTFRGAILTNYAMDEDGKYSTNSITNSFYQYIPSRIVHNLTQDTWFTNIQPAVDAAINNDVIEVYPGEFVENVDINNKDGIILQARSYVLSGINTNTIINGNNAGIGVRIRGGTAGMELFGFTIKNGNTAGIQIDGGGTRNNKIYANVIYSNTTYGIYINNINDNTNYGNIIHDSAYGICLESQPNTVYSNTVYNCSNSGIYLDKVSSASLEKNYVYNNKYGYYLEHTGAGGSSGNIIRNSEVYSNIYGIYLASDKIDASTIVSNNIINNTNAGIYIYQSDDNVIKFNNILSSATNIFIATTSINEVVSNNNIKYGSVYGIYAADGTGLKINLNTITSNNIGLAYVDTLGVNVNFDANNIMANTSWNFYNNTLIGGVLVSVTNVWWGSTIYTNIQKGITNTVITSAAGWVPYRLFGEFNIQPGADTTYLPRITMATAYVVGGNDVVVQWNQIGNPTGDFVKYNVYRTTNSTGWSNLTYNDVWTQINNIAMTNITNYNLTPNTYYYYITAMDSAPFTNECWYSPAAIVTVTPPVTNVWNISQNTYYPTIMSAVSNANNNDILEVLTPMTYNEKIILSPLTTSATHITIGTKDWWTNGTIGNVILTSSGSTNIIVTNGYSLRLEGFVITNNTVGAYMDNTTGSTLQYNIWAGNTNAIGFRDATNIMIYSNVLRNNLKNIIGIRARDSVLKFNKVYDSLPITDSRGISIISNFNQNVSLISNEVYNINYTGIVLGDIVDSTIKGNKVYNNLYEGIYVGGINIPATNNYIIENEIYSNQNAGFNNAGLRLAFTNHNNYIISNIIYFNDKGLRITGTNENNYIIGNNIYKNSNGITGENSISTYFSNNRIYSNFKSGLVFVGTSLSNRVAESKIYGNDNVGLYINGNNADYNEIVKNYIYNNKRYNIALATNCNYITIANNYVISHSTNSILLYQNNDNIIITNNIIASNYNGVVVFASSGLESDNFILKNNQIFSNQNTAVYLERVRNAGITNNKIYDSKYGIYTIAASNSYFVTNEIFNCVTNGIAVVGDTADNNFILRNVIYDINNGAGLIVDFGDYNLIQDNIVHNNKSSKGTGIAVRFSAVSNIVKNNIVYSNESAGVAFFGNNCKLNSAYSNDVYRNKRGIYIGGKTNYVYHNWNITYNSNGITIENATNCVVYQNYVANNYDTGVKVSRGQGVKVMLNTIVSNNTGVWMTNSSSFTLVKNNIYTNTTWNLETLNPVTLAVTNNWWGTTVLSSLWSKISGLSSSSNLVPYRLFGPFDITIGADTTPPANITSFTANVVSISNVALRWNSSAGAVRYFIYRNNINSWTNFTKSSVVGITTSTNWTDTGVADGTWYYWVTALDDATYTNETWYSTVQSVFVDRIGPSAVKLISPVSNFATNTNSINFVWSSATDSGSGVTNYRIVITNYLANWGTNIVTPQTNLTVAGIAEGTNWWKVQAQDKAGNWGSFSNIWSVIVDMTPPNITTLISPNNIWTNSSSVNFVWHSTSDNLTGVSNYILFITNTSAGWSTNLVITTTNTNITGIPDGINEWMVRAVDVVGNLSGWSGTNIVKIDTVPPVGVPNLIAPPDNFVTNNVATTFVWSSISDALSGITNYILQITNISGWSTNVVATGTNYTINVPQSTNFWYVRAKDRAGNYSGWSVTNAIIIDNINPTPVVLISPTNNAIETNKSGVGYVWSSGFDGETGITNYRLYVTNTTTGWSTNIVSDTTNTNFAVNGEGIYKWFVADYDRAGNFAYSGTNQFTYDTNAPAKVTLIAPTNNAVTNSQSGVIDFNWTSSSDTMTAIYYELQISTNNFTSVWSNVIVNTTNYAFTNLNLGTNWWRVRAADYAGHFSEWSSTNKFYYSEFIQLAYFKIVHNTNAYVSTWTPVRIYAIATNGAGTERIYTNYTGTVTIDVYGTSTSIDMTGFGIFGTNAVGSEYTYQFVSGDNGTVSLNIRDNTAESISIDVKSGSYRDINNEGYLYFWLTNPFIVSISQPGSKLGKQYVTVDDITPIEIRFSLLIDESTITNIKLVDKSGNPIGVTYTIITNTGANNWYYSIVRVSNNLNPTNNVLTDYSIKISTNVASTNGNRLVQNPYNTNYSAPYNSSYSIMVDKDYGGTVYDGINPILTMEPNVLPDDAFVQLNKQPDDTVKSANNIADLNQYIERIVGYNLYYKITAFNRDLKGIVNLKSKAEIKISYSDSDNDGFVDGTSIPVDKLKIFILDEKTGQWRVIPDCTVDTVNKVVIGKIDKFGKFTVMGYYGAFNFDESFITYPNPAIVGKQIVKLRFYLSKAAKLTVKIYTITGDFVITLCENKVFEPGLYEGDNAIKWDGKNENGVDVVNGVYLIKVDGEYLDGSGKIHKKWKQGILK